MAGYVHDNTTNPKLALISYNILTDQQFQLGEMQGWLDDWQLPRETASAQMVWMGHDYPSGSLMPGMVAPDQMHLLLSTTGTPMDVLFLQLMIHHHQGGIPMASFAVAHAKQPYVRALAQRMVFDQNAEIVDMEQLLRQLGGAPLPPPAY